MANPRVRITSPGTQPEIENRLSAQDNTPERVYTLQNEFARMFSLPETSPPTSEDFPKIYHELPTLWDMIEKKTFKWWKTEDQTTMMKMLNLHKEIVSGTKTYEDAEKEGGVVLADRFIHSKLNPKKSS
jgi:hypothetical protein